MNRLAGKIALVTGSTYGIGYSIAKRLAQEGAKVIICSREEQNVEESKRKLASEGLHVSALPCHVAEAAGRKRVLEEAEKLGGLDILVSNAAVNPKVAITGVYNCPEDAWDKVFEVNVKSAFLLSKEALPLLRKSNSGRIIYISTAAAYNTQEKLGAYGVSKAALLGLTKQGSHHLAKYNITVNCVAPGLIETNFSNVLFRKDEDLRHWLSTIPLNRLGASDDISGAVAFLASQDASYITGETIIVAGGMNCRI